MRRSSWITTFVVTAFTLFSVAVHADSIPTYNLTQGTITVTGTINATDTFSFSDGNGVAIGGIDTSPPFEMDPVGAGGIGNPFLGIGLNLVTSNVNGAPLFLSGVVTITGPNFTAPASGAA